MCLNVKIRRFNFGIIILKKLKKKLNTVLFLFQLIEIIH